jgi:hypothetical protein
MSRVILMFLVEDKFGVRGRNSSESSLGAPSVPQVQ